MKYRYLGNSGFKVSELTYGNWLTHAMQVDEAAALATVHAALDGGITSFDTADVYANQAAEVVLGKALAGVRREGIELFTKCYWPVAERGANDTGLSRKHIMESINGSLKRLQTDHIDLYQAHRFDYETPLEETLKAFDDLIRQGKVNYIGVSEWRASEIAAALKIQDAMGYDRFVSSQPQYSMLWRVIEKEIVPLSEKEGIGQIVWSPIAQGILTGKYLPGKKAPAGSRATDKKSGANMISGWMRDEVLEGVQKLVPIAQSVGLSMAQLAIAWVLQNKNVSSAIIGASKAKQVKENVKAAGVKLEPSVMKAIDDAIGGLAERDPAKGKSPEKRP